MSAVSYELIGTHINQYLFNAIILFIFGGYTTVTSPLFLPLPLLSFPHSLNLNLISNRTQIKLTHCDNVHTDKRREREIQIHLHLYFSVVAFRRLSTPHNHKRNALVSEYLFNEFSNR